MNIWRIRAGEIRITRVSLNERFERNPRMNVANSPAAAMNLRLSEMITEAETI
jgi:hypothetical protein